MASATFTAEYAMDTTKFWHVVKIVFIIFNGIFGALLVLQMIVWCRTPSLSDDASAQCKYAVVKMFITALDLYSYLFFWFLVVLSGYWFIFFKCEERVYMLLPALNTGKTNYMPFNILFAIVIAFKLLSIIYKIAFE